MATLFHLLTALVPHCAGSLAGRLAGSLALAAAALLHGFLQVPRGQSLDVLHIDKPPLFIHSIPTHSQGAQISALNHSRETFCSIS